MAIFAGEALQEATSGDSAYKAIHRILRNLQQPGAAGQVPSKAGKDGQMTPAGLGLCPSWYGMKDDREKGGDIE